MESPGWCRWCDPGNGLEQGQMGGKPGHPDTLGMSRGDGDIGEEAHHTDEEVVLRGADGRVAEEAKTRRED